MNYRPNPLLYGANEDFFGTFKIVVTMGDPVNHETLARAVAGAMKRYPYFTVTPVQEGSRLMLEFNPLPVPVFSDGRCVVLGAEESNGHLLTFGCEGNRIILNVSHYIADGMGIFPLLKTVLYLYVAEVFGTDGLNPKGFLMPDEAVLPEEYAYPFPDEPMEVDDFRMLKEAPEQAYGLDAGAFDADGLYAYHVRVPQKALMAKANPSDGSPVSFLSIMLHRAINTLDSQIDQPVVVHVQHQYRSVLNTPLNRHSLVSYIPVVLPPRMKEWHVERQNTVVRGQIIIGSEKSTDLCAINRLVSVFPQDDSMSLAEKEQAMRQYIEKSACGKTFGISYVGKMDWCGLDPYIQDMHVYLGEKHTPNMLLIEVMTIGDDFSLTFMQGGCGSRYVDAFIEQFHSFDIPARIVGGERYTMCDTKIPDGLQ